MDSLRGIHRYMKENGFTALRDVKHGTLYTDGTTQILAGRATYRNARNVKNLEADVKRALSARPAVEQVPPPVDKTKNLENTVMTLKATMGDFIKRQQPGTYSEPRQQVVKINPVSVEQPKPIAPAPTVDKKEPRRFHYTERQRTHKRIRDLYESGVQSPVAIASKMAEEGFQMPNGEPVHGRYVTGVVWNSRELWESENPGLITQPIIPSRPQLPLVSSNPAQPTANLPTFVLILLTDPNLKNQKKIAMLANLVKVSRARVPEIVISLIEDGSLNDDEKIQMLMGYVDL